MCILVLSFSDFTVHRFCVLVYVNLAFNFDVMCETKLPFVSFRTHVKSFHIILINIRHHVCGIRPLFHFSILMPGYELTGVGGLSPPCCPFSCIFCPSGGQFTLLLAVPYHFRLLFA